MLQYSTCVPTSLYIIGSPVVQFVKVKMLHLISKHLHVSLSSLPPSQTQFPFFTPRFNHAKIDGGLELAVTVNSITVGAVTFLTGGLQTGYRVPQPAVYVIQERITLSVGSFMGMKAVMLSPLC